MINNEPLDIVIAEDEKVISSSIEQIIKSNFADIRVTICADGLTAWHAVSQLKPAILITDIAMPGMDGIDLTMSVKENTQTCDTYVVVITALHNSSQLVRAFEAGADDYVPKPFNREELYSRIKSALRIVSMQQQLRKDNRVLAEQSEQLEQDFQEILKLGVGFVSARLPEAGDMVGRISKMTVWAAKQYGGLEHREIREIEVAAHMCLAGKLFLPDAMLRNPVTVDGRPFNDLMCQIPITAERVMQSSESFKSVGRILKHVFENLDGTGFPDRLMGWQIPIGSRIIRVMHDFEEFRIRGKLSIPDALDAINKIGRAHV